jgi:hypothetical protein
MTVKGRDKFWVGKNEIKSIRQRNWTEFLKEAGGIKNVTLGKNGEP